MENSATGSELRDRRSCLYQGLVYPEASRVCGQVICIVCREGEWKEMPID